jgi:DNA-binding winged helix-turn-helix (wHTH) protein/cytochrome c-type biogenesis protein CcmH/NrfG
VQPGVRLAFGPFELDPARRRLLSSGEPVAISDRQIDILLLLVARAGQIVAKDDLIHAGWKDVAVGDNSLEQAISNLRRLLGPHRIETIPRRGYRFGGVVERKAPRESDAGLDALLAPHRAFVEGRAALETFDGAEIARARSVFEGTLTTAAEHASAHIGLANACVMQFEMTRADPIPDGAALAVAVRHAREACRLDPQSGEAWSTLGFVLDRAGDRTDALAAAKRAVTLEPDNWRHQFRLSFVGWGEERLRAAHRTLALLPDFPLAHWLAATVHVARQVLIEAERELGVGLAAQGAQTRFSPVALHWLLGLIHLARGDEKRAAEELELELASQTAGHLYSRETAANTWYALGALRLRQGRSAEARDAFAAAIERVAMHPMARLGMAAADAFPSPPPPGSGGPVGSAESQAASAEAAMVRAGQLVLTGALADAAHVIDRALEGAAPGNAGWLLPLEPLLNVTADPETWARPLARLRNRAA